MGWHRSSGDGMSDDEGRSNPVGITAGKIQANPIK
jgi:hypothetical protein